MKRRLLFRDGLIVAVGMALCVSGCVVVDGDVQTVFTMGRQEAQRNTQNTQAQAGDITEKEKAIAQFDARGQALNKREVGIIRKEGQLSERERLVVEKEAAIKNPEKQAAVVMKQQKEIEKRQHALKEFEQNLLQLQTNLNEQVKKNKQFERDLVQRKISWLEKEKQVEAAINDLQQRKLQLEEEFTFKKQEFDDLHARWDEYAPQLEDAKKLLKQTTNKMTRLAETDLALMKEKEEELIDTVSLLEQERKRVEKKTATMLKALQKLDAKSIDVKTREENTKALDRDLKIKEKELQKGLATLAKDQERVTKLQERLSLAKELKMNIPQMEKRHDLLKKELDKAEAKLMAVAPEALAKRELLKDLEGQVKSRGQELKTREILLTNRESILERKEKRFEEHEDEALMDYMHETVEKEIGKLPTKTRYPEIQELLDQARSALNRNDTNIAVRLAAEIDLLLDKLKGVEEKQKFTYDLLELKTDIKLASLAE